MATNRIVNDGYTESGKVKEKKNLYKGLSFKWRPLTPEQRGEYAMAAVNLNGPDWVRLKATYLVDKVVWWDEKGEDGSPLPVSLPTVLSLKPALFEVMFEIISGERGPDESLDDKTDDEATEEVRDRIAAAREGKTVQEVREARHRKN